MRRILLRIAYDGTAYAGFQAQAGEVRTIAGVLNETLSALTGEEIVITGGSRTDAGVHALDNVAVFDTASRIPGEKFSYALNERLPEDIRVRHAREVEADFDLHRRAREKTYCYTIHCAPFPDPMRRFYVHYLYRKPDVESMQKAAAFLVGEHDFTSFASIYGTTKTNVRCITGLSVEEESLSEEESLLRIRVTGNGFLYNMVRIITGTLLEVGRGRFAPEDVQRILSAKDRRAAGPTAPARGLVLEKYTFSDEKI